MSKSKTKLTFFWNPKFLNQEFLTNKNSIKYCILFISFSVRIQNMYVQKKSKCICFHISFAKLNRQTKFLYYFKFLFLQKEFQSIVCSWIGEKQIKDIKKQVLHTWSDGDLDRVHAGRPIHLDSWHASNYARAVVSGLLGYVCGWVQLAPSLLTHLGHPASPGSWPSWRVAAFVRQLLHPGPMRPPLQPGTEALPLVPKVQE